jgi:hypothetical protein
MNLPVAVGAVAATLLLTLVATYLVGRQLPATRSATASVRIDAAPIDVMKVLGDVASQPTWRTDVLSVEIRSADEWLEQRQGGESITFRVVDRSDLALTLAFDSTRGYHGKWRGVLSAVAGGLYTDMQVEESATVPAPLRRVLARLLFNPQEFAAEYLSRLAAEVRRRSATPPALQGQQPRPQHSPPT